MGTTHYSPWLGFLIDSTYGTRGVYGGIGLEMEVPNDVLYPGYATP
jgi:hypothetical protein